jgi:hypothetical protein
MDYEWWDGAYDMAVEDGREKGFYIDKIYFSGFHSQGDGASWAGQVDVRQWLEKNVPDSDRRVSVVCFDTGRRCQQAHTGD